MINTGEIAEEYRLSHWAGIMQERNAKGMSIREYCKSQGMHENVYYYWQRKLREATCEQIASQELHPFTEKRTETGLLPAGWAQVTALAPTDEKTISIEIGKICIKASESTDTELLAKVCRTLMTL